MKPYLLLLLIVLASCSLLEEEEQRAQSPQAIRQWATGASASSAFGGLLSTERDDQSPYAATGQPDVQVCDDSRRAWAPEAEDAGMQWLELTYDQELYVSSIRIHENFGPGAVARIELEDAGQYRTVWQGTDMNDECPGVFQVTLREEISNVTWQMTNFDTDTVRIYLDTRVEGWNEIDAVEMIGYEQRWTIRNDTLVTS